MSLLVSVSTLRLVFAVGLLALCACEQAVNLPKLAASDVVLAFGDSLTFGTGADEAESYPLVLGALIGRKVIRSGVPGETTAEGLERLPEVLDAHQPKLVVLCLGGNDFLRRVNEAQTRANLRAMLVLLKQRGVASVLVGVPQLRVFASPPKWYAALAQEFGALYEGEGLQEVLYDNSLKSDHIHPNALGYRRFAERLAQVLDRGGAI